MSSRLTVSGLSVVAIAVATGSSSMLISYRQAVVRAGGAIDLRVIGADLRIVPKTATGLTGPVVESLRRRFNENDQFVPVVYRPAEVTFGDIRERVMAVGVPCDYLNLVLEHGSDCRSGADVPIAAPYASVYGPSPSIVTAHGVFRVRVDGTLSSRSKSTIVADINALKTWFAIGQPDEIYVRLSSTSNIDALATEIERGEQGRVLVLHGKMHLPPAVASSIDSVLPVLTTLAILGVITGVGIALAATALRFSGLRNRRQVLRSLGAGAVVNVSSSIVSLTHSLFGSVIGSLFGFLAARILITQTFSNSPVVTPGVRFPDAAFGALGVGIGASIACSLLFVGLDRLSVPISGDDDVFHAYSIRWRPVGFVAVTLVVGGIVLLSYASPSRGYGKVAAYAGIACLFVGLCVVGVMAVLLAFRVMKNAQTPNLKLLGAVSLGAPIRTVFVALSVISGIAVSVLAPGVESSIVHSAEKRFEAHSLGLVVRTRTNEPLPEALVSRISTLPEVDHVERQIWGWVQPDRQTTVLVRAFDRPWLDNTVVSGRAQLDDNALLVSVATAKRFKLDPGSKFRVPSAGERGEREFRVSGVWVDTSLNGLSVQTTFPSAAALLGTDRPNAVVVFGSERTKDELSKLLATSSPALEVRTARDQTLDMRRQISQQFVVTRTLSRLLGILEFGAIACAMLMGFVYLRSLLGLFEMLGVSRMRTFALVGLEGTIVGGFSSLIGVIVGVANLAAVVSASETLIGLHLSSRTIAAVPTFGIGVAVVSVSCLSIASALFALSKQS